MATLVINRSESKCAGCGLAAVWAEERHVTVPGYGSRKVGCGQFFTKLSTDYVGMEDLVRLCRPDLPWEHR